MTTAIGNRGYTIIKEEHQSSVINNVRKDLTVKPFVSVDYNANIVPFAIYAESKRKLYIPRYYGLTNFGEPSTYKLNTPEKINLTFNGSLKEKQISIVNAYTLAIENKNVGGGIISVPCGFGKCFARDTEVLMYDGSIKLVQDIKINDLLMGDDVNPRNVRSLARGREIMYKIIQENANDYTVNESHILSLYSKTDKKVIDISLKDYINLPKNIKADYLGYRVVLDFYCNQSNSDNNSISIEHAYKDGTIFNYTNYIIQTNLIVKYKFVNAEIRYSFLKGIIECSASYWSRIYNRIFTNNLLVRCPDYLRENLLFIIRSLGIRASIWNNDIININCSEFFNYRENEKIHLSPITVEKLEEGYYYGFTLDSNPRFLLSDFTVAHNTVIALNIISKLNLKTLVVVHKEFLLNQWIERINQFLPGSRVGRIQSNIVRKENKDIVIGMLQSISMIDYQEETFEDFGLVIYDECHHLGAEVFSRALLKTNAPYTLGLSATPTRGDGLTKVFHWYLGPMIYSIRKRDDKNVNVKMIHFTLDEDSEGNEIIDKDYNKIVLNFRGKPNGARMINNICSFMPRVTIIINEIVRCLHEGRKILLLSDRKNHLALIYTELQKLADNIASFNYTFGYYLGGMKPSELEKTELKNVILGTFSMASEGFDCREHLDTIILASPKTNIEQSIGRILRQEEKDRKIIPLVIDIVDDFCLFSRQALKRAKFYTKNNYKIETFNNYNEPNENHYIKKKKQKASELEFLDDSE